jgi:PAS domain S-box-containing protein
MLFAGVDTPTLFQAGGLGWVSALAQHEQADQLRTLGQGEERGCVRPERTVYSCPNAPRFEKEALVLFGAEPHGAGTLAMFCLPLCTGSRQPCDAQEQSLREGAVMRRTSRPETPLPPHSQGAIRSTTNDSETEQLASEVLSELAEGIATLAADRSVISWNPHAEHLTGYTLEQINTVGLVEIFDPRAVMDHLLREAHNGLTTFGERLRLRRQDGTLVHMHVQCSPVLHLHGIEGRVVVVMREVALLEARLRRDARLIMLGRLAGTLAHEIRNPLNAVFLQVDILDEELRQPTPDHRVQLEQSVQTLKTEITRLKALIQDYLSLSRLSEVRREPVDIGAMLKAFAQEIQASLADSRITVQLEGFEGLGVGVLHPPTFRRALLNLVQNARDAMPQGGTLTLRGWRTATQIHLAVCDTGQGIPAEQLPLLFTPFHTTKPEGTGLGLYVVQEIVGIHEGTIEVTSEPNRGTTMTITLPQTSSR